MGRVLGIGLFFLSLGLSFGPLIYGFASHNWNYKALVTPEPNPLDGEKPDMEIENFTADNLTLEFSSPVSYASLRLDNISADIYCSKHDKRLGSLSLHQTSITIPAGSSRDVVLHVTSLDNFSHLRKKNENRVDIKNPSFTIYGIKIKVPDFENVEISV